MIVKLYFLSMFSIKKNNLFFFAAEIDIKSGDLMFFLFNQFE